MEQASEGAPHIILNTSHEFYVCRRPAATPNIDTTMLLMNERRVGYLLVPVIWRDTRGSS
jgi:hypothetical protein